MRIRRVQSATVLIRFQRTLSSDGVTTPLVATGGNDAKRRLMEWV